MCHDHFHRSREWDRQIAEELGDADEEEEPDADDIPSFLADEEPDGDLEVLTDGGDEA